jgi:hypothetical protein
VRQADHAGRARDEGIADHGREEQQLNDGHWATIVCEGVKEIVASGGFTPGSLQFFGVETF